MAWFKLRAIALPLFLVVTSASSVSRTLNEDSSAADGGEPSGKVGELPFCDPVQQAKRLIFVSTLDGRVSALNVDGGEQQWSIETGPGAMLSSSIHTLELTNNGQWVRMIPSLSGGLYKMNGKTVEAVPISADHLLKSSFRYSDDLVISGGVESRTYGVDVTSGKVLYECSMASCDNQNETNELSGNQGDIVLIQRHTQTVRAVEPRTGIERWNFSVGQHDLKISVDPAAYCHSSKDNNRLGDLIFKVIVPDGLVCALDTSGNVVWKHKFEFPVVSAWQVDGAKVKWVDLFGGTRTPEEKLYLPKSPVLYIGMHNKQLYIQESVRLQNKVLESANRLKHHLITDDSLPSIPWAPIPATPGFLGIEGPKDLLQITDETSSTTGLSVLYASEYVNGKGFYLYGSDDEPKSIDVSSDKKICTDDKNGSTVTNYSSEDEQDDIFHDTVVEVEDFAAKIIETPIVITSFWYWWKEVLLTSIIAAIIINVILQRRLITFFYWMAVNESKAQEKSGQSGTTTTTATTSVSSASSNHSQPSQDNYVSRYLTDFEQIACLGKGGFGVVFHARNKIDESEYAIKRITLSNKEETHDRMKREVKALAKLDHQNIVRYFNSWEEDPPLNWQETQDRCWAQAHSDVMVDLTGHVTPTSETPGTTNNSLRNRSILKSVYKKATSIFYESNSLKLPFDEPPNRRRAASYDDSSGSSIIFVNPKSENGVVEDTRQLTSSTSGRKSRAERPTSLSLDSSPPPSTPVRRKFLYIQMQLCKRDSLKDWLKATPKREKDEVLNIFNQILLAVEYVHFQGLIHRDLKPSNIFFSYDGQIKVGDFGLVTAMTDDDVGEFRSPLLGRRGGAGIVDERHTAHVGTHLYMSPEQVEGKQYDYKVDIYSLGVIFFELLTSFNTEMERYKTLEKVRELTFPPDFNKKHSAEHKLLLMMLSSNPKNRPTTIGIRSREPMVKLQPDGSLSQEGHFQLPFRHREPSFTRTRTSTESS